MTRLYANKKDYQKGIAKDGMIYFDDRSVSFGSDCFNCKHFREWDFFCKAYPDGIPEEILDGDVSHTEVRSDQKGNTVFEKK